MSELQHPAYEAWFEYYTKTEEYDRLQCTGRRNGVAVPINAGEERKSNAYARSIHNRIIKPFGFDESHFVEFRKIACRESEKKLGVEHGL